MPDAPAPATVRLSRLPGSETLRRAPCRRDDAETNRETLCLKALARLVIARDSQRDTERDTLSRSVLQTERTPETASTGKTAAAARREIDEEREHDGGVPTIGSRTEEIDQGQSATVIAPLPFAESALIPDLAEPGVDEPCEARRGVVEWRGPAFVHFCSGCGRWGAYGISGRWFCRLHLPR